MITIKVANGDMLEITPTEALGLLEKSANRPMEDPPYLYIDNVLLDTQALLKSLKFK